MNSKFLLKPTRPRNEVTSTSEPASRFGFGRLLSSKAFYLLAALLCAAQLGKQAQAQTTVYSDDFNRTTLNGTYNYSSSVVGGDGGASIVSNQLQLTNDASATANANGRVFTSTPTTAFGTPFNPILKSNTGLVTWTFNMRSSRPDPAGFGTGSYGMAYILGSTTSVANTGNGYAVVYGNSGNPDQFRLVRFTGGLSTTTNIISADTNSPFNVASASGSNYFSFRVTYDPSNDSWNFYGRNDGASGFVDPSSGVTTPVLTTGVAATDSTYTGSSLGFLGPVWNYSTGANQTASFDNFKVVVGTAPPVGTLQLSSATYSVNESGPTADITVTRTGGSAGAVDVTYTASTQTGNTATADTDYTASTGTVSFSDGETTSKTFSIPITQDALVEGNETFNVALSNPTNGATLGTPSSATVTILDDEVVNTAPTAVNDPYSTNEDITLTVPAATGVLSNDTDAENNTLTAVKVTDPTHGTLTLNSDGSFTYVPTANYNGSDSFTYKANDGQVDSNTATVTITVNAVNDAPVNTVPGAQSTLNNAALVFSSANGNAISVADVDAGTGDIQVTLNVTNGTVTVGTTNVTVTGNGSGTVTVTGSVTNVNAALNGLSFTATTGYSGAASIQVNTNDQGNTGGAAQTDSDTVNITVTAPVTPVNIYISELLFDPPGTDSPNEYIEIRGPANLTLPSGTYLVGIEGDGTGSGDVQDIFDLSGKTIGSNGFLIIFQKSNSYSTVVSPNASVYTNSGTGAGFGSGTGSSIGHTADSGATDIENTSVSFLLIQTNTAPTLTDDIDSNNDGTPDGAAYATWNVRDSVSILDGGSTDVGYGAINFINGGTGISTLGTNVTTTGFTGGYVGRAGDTTGSTASDWVVSSSATTGGITGSAPNYTLGTNTLPASYVGRALNHIGSANFPATNSAPVATNDSYTIAKNGTLNVAAPGVLSNDIDADGNTLTAVKVTDPSHGTVTLNANGSFTYVPTVGYIGADSFTYKANDGTTTGNTATVTIDVGQATSGVVISEFRFRGPGGSTDEYVELTSLSNDSLNIGGWTVSYPTAGGEVSITIPAGTVLPMRGYLLLANTGYSLSPSANVAITTDIPDGAGLVLRNAAGTTVDAVGYTSTTATYREGAGLATGGTEIGNDIDYAWIRDLITGYPKDTNANATDFYKVRTDDATNANGFRYGIPGPQNTASPTQRNDLVSVALLDPTKTSTVDPNRTRTGSGNSGVLFFRKKITNNTGKTITSMRLRLVDAVAGTPTTGVADLRLTTTGDTTATVNGNTVNVLGITFDNASLQSTGGGYNTTATVPLPGGSLAPGASINIQIGFNIFVSGSYHYAVNVEILTTP